MTDVSILGKDVYVNPSGDLWVFQRVLSAALIHLDDPQMAHPLLAAMNHHLDKSGLQQTNPTQYARLRHMIEQICKRCPLHQSRSPSFAKSCVHVKISVRVKLYFNQVYNEVVRGVVTERFKVSDLKSAEQLSVPWVRIPSTPFG